MYRARKHAVGKSKKSCFPPLRLGFGGKFAATTYWLQERDSDPETLVTVVRYIEPASDFQRLARFLETDVNE
jgi:hypothetical protein